MFVGRRRGAAGGETAKKRNHLYHDRTVVVREACQWPEVGERTAELFLNFAVECQLRSLAGLDFATGKLPLEPEVLVGGPLGEQQVADLIVKEGADDGDR